MNRSSRITRILMVSAVAGIVGLAACSSGSSPSANTPVAPNPPTPVDATPVDTMPVEATPVDTTPVDAIPVDTTPVDTTVGEDAAFEVLERATVRISTTGSFVDPDFGQVDTGAGSGSGFIVDAEGHIVTNNHVVAGAAIVEVWLSGADDPTPATVVARSECSDLAVIALDGDGYETLAFSDRPAAPGLNVFAAGYPDGFEQFALSSGIVARDEFPGATAWADVDVLLQHDADMRAGNSGGPLVTASGEVIGVNVAGGELGQFAIPATVAEPVVDELLAGNDVDSIGINAAAVWDEDTNESGVWVVSVQPGSAAEAAGLLPGDVISRMKGIRVATDGTLADYCGIIRSTPDREPISIEVVRDGDHYAGEIDGEELSPVLAVVDDTEEAVSEPETTEVQPPPEGDSYNKYETVTDETGQVSIDIPVAWGDRKVIPVNRAGGKDPQPVIQASPDLADSAEAVTGGTYDVPGLQATQFEVGAPMKNTFAVIADNSPWQYDCVSAKPQSFDDGTYRGMFNVYVGCGGGTAGFVMVAVERLGSGNWLLLEIATPTLADVQAAGRAIETFEFAGEDVAATDDEGSASTTTVPAPDPPSSSVPATDGFAMQRTIAAEVGSPPGASTTPSSEREDNTGRYDAYFGEFSTTIASVEKWIDDLADRIACPDPYVQNGSRGEVQERYFGCDLDRDDTTWSVSIYVEVDEDSGSGYASVAVSPWN